MDNIHLAFANEYRDATTGYGAAYIDETCLYEDSCSQVITVPHYTALLSYYLRIYLYFSPLTSTKTENFTSRLIAVNKPLGHRLLVCIVGTPWTH